MKKSILALSLLSLTSGVALADDFTIGYAKNELSLGDFSADLTGISATYTIDLRDNKDVSFIVTSTFTNNNYKGEWSRMEQDYLTNVEIASASGSFGPQVNLNEHFSLYAVAGLDFTEITANSAYQFGSDYDIALNYGLGLKFHPFKHLSLNMGVEFATLTIGDTRYESKKFLLGGGVKF